MQAPPLRLPCAALTALGSLALFLGTPGAVEASALRARAEEDASPEGRVDAMAEALAPLRAPRRRADDWPTLAEVREQQEAYVINGTLPDNYFQGVDVELQKAAAKQPTTQPVSNGATMAPYKAIMVADQPYDARLGSALLYKLSAEATKAPPPSQSVVDGIVAKQCPLLMFDDKLFITPPKCGVDMGTWDDPNGRSVVRWKATEDGSIQNLRLGLDTRQGTPGAVNGSATFVNINHQIRWSGNLFSVQTCSGVPIWTISEKLVHVGKMGFGKQTSRPHDTGLAKPAYFVQYTIDHANGTTLAQTNLMRLNDNEVNITSTAGTVLAKATRQGKWTGTGWTQCSSKQRRWEVDFPGNVRDVKMGATAQDLRVISAAVITLMASLDEVRQPNGIVPAFGTMDVVMVSLSTLALIALLILVPLCFVLICHNTRLGDQSRLFCLRVQLWLLPQRNTQKRRDVMYSTW